MEGREKSHRWSHGGYEPLKIGFRLCHENDGARLRGTPSGPDRGGGGPARSPPCGKSPAGPPSAPHASRPRMPMSTLPRTLLPVVLAVALALPLAVHDATAQNFTLEQVMSAPFPDGLVAAQDRDVIAWVSNDRGSRNVWVAHGPEWEGRPITDWSGDDGQEVSGLQLAPDARWIVYTRGGAPNRDGWIPAPAHPVDGAERTRWLHVLEGPRAGERFEIERWGTLSPDGDRMAYVQGGRIRVAPLAEGIVDEEGAVVVARPRSGAGSLSWSPDGTRLAFVSGREGHAFVGVAEADGSGFHFLDPYVTRDRAPVWSPDGGRIAFLRDWPVDLLPFVPHREAEIPWRIMVHDLGTGETVERFVADPGAGSVFSGVTAAQPLWWTADDHLVFPWEAGGWKRLWGLPVDGGEPHLLLDGEGEVQHAALAPDGRTLVFDSNRGDIDRKHLWSARADGSELREWTPGEGIEWAPVPLPSGAVAFLGSGATMPARPFVQEAPDGSRFTPEGALPTSFPSDALVVPEPVVFPATDGMPIPGQLFRPPGLAPGERAPAIVFLHGGSRRQMLLGFHNRGYYHNAYALNQYLAARGYLVLSVNFRSGVGYGLDFREAEDYGATGASEVRDVLGAGLYLAQQDDVDPDRIGLWGGSYGGYLTAHGLAQAPELFVTGVDFHGVHDWNVGIHNFRPSYVPEIMPEFSELAFESSPLYHIDNWEAPVLLIHGDDDRNVKFSETATLVRELTIRGVPHEVLVFPDEVHGFLLHQSWLEAYQATADWFDRWMGPEPGGL